MDELDRDGYVVLRSAVEQATIGAYAEERDALQDGLLAREPGAEQVSLATQAGTDAAVVDPYAIAQAARALLLPEALTALLHDRFGEPPLLFDATGATAQPQDDAYRDATFTALATEPETLITIAVALDGDVHLAVHPGSQQIATTPFSGRYPHHNPERDGDAALARHREEITAALAPADTIILHPGDVLVWSAGLVHGPVAGSALVAHLCPTRVAPGWYAYRPERARHAVHDDGRAWIATQHYDLVDATAPPEPPADEASYERVEDALREHDEVTPPDPPPTQPPTQPQPPPARRPGGLVDSVRGALRRRGRPR